MKKRDIEEMLEAYRLHKQRGLKVREIARILNKSPSTISIWIREIKRMIMEGKIDEFGNTKEEKEFKLKKASEKPETNIRKKIEGVVIEEADQILKEIFEAGKISYEKLKDVARSLGYDNIKDFIIFLYEFWDKNRYLPEEVEKYKRMIIKYRQMIKFLTDLLTDKWEKILIRKKQIETAQMLTLLKAFGYKIDAKALLELKTLLEGG